jgi:hypothetical protein
MKRCILITSHLNNYVKIDTALNLIQSLKDKNLPIIFVGNYVIPTKIQNSVDYCFFMKENPVSNRVMNIWNIIPKGTHIGDNLKLIHKVNDYGYAHLYQTYKGFKIAESLGFDHVTHFNYDITLHDNSWDILDDYLSNSNNVVLGDGVFATNIYLFKISDFINICDNFLYLYNAPKIPDIKKDWICENFFYWMVNKSGVPYVNIKDNIVSSSYTVTYIPFKDGYINVYPYEEKNLLIVTTNNEFINDEITLTFEDGTNYKLEPTSSPKIFTLPLLKGKFYYGNNLIFNYSEISNNKVVPIK